jgi:hypothetical protein
MPNESPEEKQLAKLEILASATGNLTTQVANLTGVMGAQNKQIAKLRAEVNQKPDDVEVQLLTGMAQAERARHLHYAIITAVICGVLSGIISYLFASSMIDNLIQERIVSNHTNCVQTNKRVDRAYDYYTQLAEEERKNKFIDDELRAKRVTRNLDYANFLIVNRADCDKLYPLENK